uniref:Mannose-P-dolichol utilization defect 1a n=1 Tax=Cyclopterus lumpus TaxID=8103 RepID=A0A8C3GA55_CYCLU
MFPTKKRRQVDFRTTWASCPPLAPALNIGGPLNHSPFTEELQLTTMTTSTVKDFLVTYLMPEKCYRRIFVNLHVHGPCLKLITIRIVGFWILLDALLAQMAQLLKIVWSRSAEGLSLASVLLQLYAVSCPVVYAVANNFPFFAWGERLFILAYTAATVFLILHYRGDTLTGFLVLLAYGNVMFLLGSYAAAAVASVMQASSLTALIASKVLQARANHCNGHTGQLSILSVLLTCAGSLVILVSLQETGSLFTTLSQALSAGLSFVLLAQVLCSSGSTATTKANSQPQAPWRRRRWRVEQPNPR